MTRTRRLTVQLAAAVGLVLCPGCDNTPPPTSFVDFPDVTCGDTRIGTSVDASLVADPQGGEQPAFLIKACVRCSDDPVTSLSNIQGEIDSPPPGTPLILTRPFGFGPTNQEGCSTIGFPNVPPELVGATVWVRIPDESGKIVLESDAVIRDRR